MIMNRDTELAWFASVGADGVERFRPCEILERYDFAYAVLVRFDTGEELITTIGRLRPDHPRGTKQLAKLRHVVTLFNDLQGVDGRFSRLARDLGTSVIGVIAQLKAAQRRGLAVSLEHTPTCASRSCAPHVTRSGTNRFCDCGYL